MKDWEPYISQAEYIPGLKVDIIYSILDNFYYDDQNSFIENPWQKQKELLKRPTHLLYEDCGVLSNDLRGNEQSLIDYYFSILDNAKQHNKKLLPGQSCFWLSPLIFKKNEENMGFRWHQTFRDAIPFFNALQKKEDTCVFNEDAPDWHLSVFTEKEKIHFIASTYDEGWEQDEPGLCITGDRAAIAEMAKAVLQRVEKQLAVLTQHLGRDYWTETEDHSGAFFL